MAISVKASEKGLRIVDEARRLKGWAKTEPQWLRLAMVSRSTLKRFWAGSPIQRDSFIRICAVLDVEWEKVCDTELVKNSSSNPLDVLEIFFLSQDPTKDNNEIVKQQVVEAFHRYIQNFSDRHGLLKVLGMSKPVKLEAVYTSLQFLGERNLWQFDPLRLEESYRLSQSRSFQSEQNEKRDGLEVANANQNLMVLGQLGAGKSTFLRRIGLEALKGQRGNYQHGCIPVFLELKRFTSGEMNLVQAIADEFSNCRLPNPMPATQKLLDQGRLLILLDGLDELPEQLLDQTITQIQDFADKYKENRFIASCRTAAYKSGFRKFVDVVMADFDDDQIQQFINNWFRAEKDIESGTAQRCWELLTQSVHAATKELAQTPLLLTLLCLVFDDSQNFPEKRAELYKQALDVLLSKWAAEKRIQHDPIYKDLTLTLENIMLGEIAYNGFEADRLFFSQQEVVDQIRIFLTSNLNAPNHLDGEEILNTIQVQQGILVERVKNVFSFSHLTLQEYLTAQHIADNNLLETLVRNHLTDQRWREVFLLVSGITRPSADSLLLQIERQAQNFINTFRLRAILDWATRETQDPTSVYDQSATRVCALFFALSLGRGLDLALDFNRTLDRVLVLALVLERPLALDLGLDRVVSLSLHFDLDRAREVKESRLFKSANFSNLIDKLETLKLHAPNDQHPYKVHRAFADQIYSAWCNMLNIEQEWLELTQAELEALNNYFYANELMIRCKEAAVRVSPQVWAEIESRMFTVYEQSEV